MTWLPDWLTNDKGLLSIASIAFGWLLAQGTTLVKDWLNIRRLKDGLLIELEDIQAQLGSLRLYNNRSLQLFGAKALGNEKHPPIHNLFFKHYFKDVFGNLNREQRISYQLIHSHLDHLNQEQVALVSFYEKNYEVRYGPADSDDARKALREFGDRFIALQRVTLIALWHIHFHLHHRKSPHLDYGGPVHQSYLHFLNEVEDEIKKTIADAGSLKREDFERAAPQHLPPST